MKKLVFLCAGLAMVLNLIACDSKDKYKRVSPRDIKENAALTKPERSDQLTEAAEELMTPTGFIYAEMIIDMALDENPGNKKAQFYKAFLQIKNPLKGLLKRAKPLASSTATAKAQYDGYLAELPESNLRSYLFNAANEDIKTESDLQLVTDQVYGSLEKFRQFLKANKDLDLTLRLTEAGRNREEMLRQTKDCAVEIDGPDQYRIKAECKLRTLTYKLNRADIETLAQMVLGVQLYAIGSNSYDLTELLAALQKKSAKEEGDQVMSNKEFYEAISKNPKFGILRQSNSLKNIISMGADLGAAVKWLMSVQSEVCKQVADGEKRREGHLFYDGMCVEDGDGNYTRFVKIMEAFAAGKQLDVIVGKSEARHIGLAEENLVAASDEYKTKLLANNFLNKPLQDVKQLAPVFNQCDQVGSITDNDFSGALVLKDANKILEASGSCPVTP